MGTQTLQEDDLAFFPHVLLLLQAELLPVMLFPIFLPYFLPGLGGKGRAVPFPSSAALLHPGKTEQGVRSAELSFHSWPLIPS